MRISSVQVTAVLVEVSIAGPLQTIYSSSTNSKGPRQISVGARESESSRLGHMLCMHETQGQSFCTVPPETLRRK